MNGFIYWRFKNGQEWRWAWVAEHLDNGLVRLGEFFGDSRGAVVSPQDIEWRRAS